MAEEVERILTIPLSDVKNIPRTKRAPVAVRKVREFVGRHMKADLEEVWLDDTINHAIWARGIQKPPSKLRVRAIKFEDGLVEVSLPE